MAVKKFAKKIHFSLLLRSQLQEGESASIITAFFEMYTALLIFFEVLQEDKENFYP